MDNLINAFALNQEQHQWMLSLKAIKVQTDINEEKDSKKQAAKQRWMDIWLEREFAAYEETFSIPCPALPKSVAELLQYTEKVSANSENDEWYYLSVIEAEFFEPYYPLYVGDDAKEKNKQFKVLKYKQPDFLKNLIVLEGKISGSFIDRIQKAYNSAVARMEGRYSKIAIASLSTLAAAAATAATAGTLAGPIAVALVGSNFPWAGAALTTASLAFIGGGSIAAGGAGIAGGVATIVGGGALLGFAVSGAASATATGIILAAPQTALQTAAKLEVTIRELILCVRNDVPAANHYLAQYKESVKQLKHLAVDLESGEKKSAEQAKALKTSISYLSRSIQFLEKFISSYEIGLTSETAKN